MICVTGDIHGDLNRFKHPKIKALKKHDTLIVCGDFGFIWDGGEKEKKLLKHLGKRKYSILFVDGVHESFSALNAYPVESWNGGKTRHIYGNLRQLMRGQVFDISGKSFFTFGGGQSEDNDFFLEVKTPNVGEHLEIPTEEELREGLDALNARDNAVDYIITYEPPAMLSEFLSIGTTDRNHVNTYLDEIRERVSFKKWFFGRHHQNKLIPPKYHALFNDVIIIE